MRSSMCFNVDRHFALLFCPDGMSERASRNFQRILGVGRIPHLAPKTTPPAAAPYRAPQNRREADSPRGCISGLRRPKHGPNSRQAAELAGTKLKIGLSPDLNAEILMRRS